MEYQYFENWVGIIFIFLIESLAVVRLFEVDKAVDVEFTSTAVNLLKPGEAESPVLKRARPGI